MSSHDMKIHPKRRGGHMGHGGMGAPVEKAKDFKGSIRKLMG